MTIATPKTFRVERSDDPPIPFVIELETKDPGKFETEAFNAKPAVPGSLIMDMVAAGSLGVEWQAAAMQKFFHEALVEDDRERFVKVLDESDPPIKMSQLSEITNWLIEQYGDRPTESAKPS